VARAPAEGAADVLGTLLPILQRIERELELLRRRVDALERR
jgi:hypothetical protein